jgi:hypothetical protein
MQAKFTETVIANVTPEVKQRIMREAEDLGVSQALVVRRLLDDALSGNPRCPYGGHTKAPSA